VFVEGVLEALKLLVLVVAVDGDLFDQRVEFASRLAWRAGVIAVSLGSGGWVQAVQQQRWTLADLAASGAADGLVDADGGGVLVEFDHDAFDTAEVLGSGVVVEADAGRRC
jgi:hypothetical protein